MGANKYDISFVTTFYDNLNTSQRLIFLFFLVNIHIMNKTQDDGFTRRSMQKCKN